MPSFVVTTPTDEVTLDATRKGTIPVTVSNITGRPLRVRLNLVPTSPMEAAWLSVQGEAEQEFANGTSSQFTAVVAIPATAAAGTYTFKPVAAAEDRPMEEFTEGKPLSAKVGEPTPKSKFPWWIVAAVVGVIALALILVVSIGGGNDDDAAAATTTAPTVTTLPASVKVKVPRVIGDEQPTAKAKIESVGATVRLVVDTSKDPLCNGRVVSQSPDADQMVDGGSPVFLLIPPVPTGRPGRLCPVLDPRITVPKRESPF